MRSAVLSIFAILALGWFRGVPESPTLLEAVREEDRAAVLQVPDGQKASPQDSDSGTLIEGPVTIRELSVAGYWVDTGKRSVLLDALIRHDLGPNPDVLEKMESASPPFDRADLILVTHSHRDHFSAESVARHLASNPDAVLVSGRTVGERMAERPDYDSLRDRIVVVDPEPLEVVELEANGTRLKVFRVSHGEPDNDYSLDNLGIMADLDGTRIFTTGDIVPTGQTEVFRRAGLHRDSVDFAFLAMTMFADEYQPENRTIIDELIRPRRIVVAHLYESHFGAFTDAILRRYPRAFIPGLESLSRE